MLLAESSTEGQSLSCLGVASILLQRLRTARLPPTSGMGDLSVTGLLDAVILPAAQHAGSGSVRCDYVLAVALQFPRSLRCLVVVQSRH